MMRFEVYTYFGRVLESFVVPDTELHHNAMEKARKFVVEYENSTGKQAWARIKGMK